MIKWITQNIQLVLMGASLLATGAYALTGLRRDSETERLSVNTARLKRAAIAGTVLIVLTAGVGFVPAGNRGVVFSAAGGVDQSERTEGVTLMAPFFQRLHNVDVRTKAYAFEALVQTKDLQEVRLPGFVNYHVNPSAAAEVFQEVGYSYEATIVAPAVAQAIVEAAGQIAAEDIAVSRAELTARITELVQVRLETFGLTVDYVTVSDAVFDSAFMTSIKEKVIADQNRQRALIEIEVAAANAKAVVQTAIGQADAERERGSGIADANELIDASLTADVLLFQRLEKWNGQLPTMMLGNGQDVIVSTP